MKESMLVKENKILEGNIIKVKIAKLGDTEHNPSKKFLKIWEQECRLVARFCSEINCHDCTDLVGTLVKKEKDSSLYILPLCKSHSNVNHEINIPNFMRFTPYEDHK